jgi:hypothetical protein
LREPERGEIRYKQQARSYKSRISLGFRRLESPELWSFAIAVEWES